MRRVVTAGSMTSVSRSRLFTPMTASSIASASSSSASLRTSTSTSSPSSDARSAIVAEVVRRKRARDEQQRRRAGRAGFEHLHRVDVKVLLERRQRRGRSRVAQGPDAIRRIPSGSVRIESAAAPPRAYAEACAAASIDALITPLDGDRRFTSAMTATSARGAQPRSRCRRERPAPAVPARRPSRASRAAARTAAAAESRPSGPIGGVHERFACTSGPCSDIVLFGCCSGTAAVGSTCGEPLCRSPNVNAKS